MDLRAIIPAHAAAFQRGLDCFRRECAGSELRLPRSVGALAVVEPQPLFRGFNVRFVSHDTPLPVILPPEKLSPAAGSERRQTPRHTATLHRPSTPRVP